MVIIFSISENLPTILHVDCEEAQAGIKTAGRNINNFRYADDTTLMAVSEGERKSLLMKVKEGTSLVVQWLRLCTPNAGGLGSIPGQGARSHMQQLRPSEAKLK